MYPFILAGEAEDELKRGNFRQAFMLFGDAIVAYKLRLSPRDPEEPNWALIWEGRMMTLADLMGKHPIEIPRKKKTGPFRTIGELTWIQQ